MKSWKCYEHFSATQKTSCFLHFDETILKGKLSTLDTTSGETVGKVQACQFFAIVLYYAISTF